jgi:hypothetical protein
MLAVGPQLTRRVGIMSDSQQVRKQDERTMTRRVAVKGGLASVAGAFATLVAARRGSAAVTPMDVKRGGFTQNAVTPMDVRQK